MDSKSFLIGVGTTAIVGIGAYYLGVSRIPEPASVPQAQQVVPVPAPATTPVALAPQDANHVSPALQAQIARKLAESKQPAVTDLISEKLKFHHFRVGNKNVKSMLADGPIVWVGTSGGVIRYDTRTDNHKVFDTKTGLLANGIFHLSKLNGQLVAGTYGGGLSILDETTEKWKTYNVPEGLADAFVYDMLELDNGDIWIATWSGANRIVGGNLDDASAWQTFTVANTDGGLPNDWVYGLRKGIDGDIWMATEGGLAHFKDGEWANWSHKEGLGAPYELVRDQIKFKNDPAEVSAHHARQKIEMGLEEVDIAYNPNYIVALAVDDEGIVWAGTWGGGLGRFKNGEWKNYTVSDGLPSNHVSMLKPAKNGEMWVGSSAGLSLFDGETFRVYTTDDGLFANNVFSMVVGEDDSLWVGSYGGVARIFELPD